MKKVLFILICIISFTLTNRVFATHNRAGEIRLVPIDPTNCLTFKAIITTYTKESSPADRPEFTIYWGDGDSSSLPRVNGNGNGVSIGNDIKVMYTKVRILILVAAVALPYGWKIPIVMRAL